MDKDSHKCHSFSVAQDKPEKFPSIRPHLRMLAHRQNRLVGILRCRLPAAAIREYLTRMLLAEPVLSLSKYPSEDSLQPFSSKSFLFPSSDIVAAAKDISPDQLYW